MNKLMTVFAVPLLSLWMAGPSFAQTEQRVKGGEEVPSEEGVTTHPAREGRMMKKLRKACAKDIDEFCEDVTPGHGRIAACLKAYDDQISETCRNEVHAQVKAKMEEVHRQLGEVREACKGDIDKFCKAEKGNHAQVMACLDRHEDELSTQCSDKRESLHQQLRGGGLRE